MQGTYLEICKTRKKYASIILSNVFAMFLIFSFFLTFIFFLILSLVVRKKLDSLEQYYNPLLLHSRNIITSQVQK